MFRTRTLPQNYHQFKIKKSSTPNCRCLQSIETIEHFLFEYQLNNEHRKFKINDLLYLLNDDEGIKELIEFIQVTKRFKQL